MTKIVKDSPLPAQTRGLNPFALDRNMARFLKRVAPDFLTRQQTRLHALGAFAGSTLDTQAEQSDRHYPAQLARAFDHPVSPKGRAGRVVLNPAYMACQQEVYKRGFMASCFDPVAPESHMLPFIFQYYLSYADISTGCPPAMTHPVALLLSRVAPDALRERFLPELLRTDGMTPIGGTWATERHSGSDVAQTITRAARRKDGSMRLYGHNWFASAIGFERYLTIKTARPDGASAGGAGLGLYLVPSHTDKDWQIPNKLAITHLKDKMGTRGLPTGEVTLDGTTAYELAPAGQGLRAMMSALGCSRVHNAMAAAGVMYRCYLEALCWTGHRQTFGKALIERPMIRDDVLMIAGEWMAGAALAFEAARAFDHHDKNPADKTAEGWLRIITALAKYRTAEQAVLCAKTALELVGGNGYVKDHPMERIYRDAMVLTVWEGPRHIQALEIVRMMGRDDGAAIFIGTLKNRIGAWPAALDDVRLLAAGALKNLAQDLSYLAQNPAQAEQHAGRLMDRMADLAAVTLLADEAAWELRHEQDAAKLLIVRERAQNLWAGAAHAPLAQRQAGSVLQAHFDAITRGRKVDVPPAPPKPGAPTPR